MKDALLNLRDQLLLAICRMLLFFVVKHAPRHTPQGAAMVRAILVWVEDMYGPETNWHEQGKVYHYED